MIDKAIRIADQLQTDFTKCLNNKFEWTPNSFSYAAKLGVCDNPFYAIAGFLETTPTLPIIELDEHLWSIKETIGIPFEHSSEGFIPTSSLEERLQMSFCAMNGLQIQQIWNKGLKWLLPRIKVWIVTTKDNGGRILTRNLFTSKREEAIVPRFSKIYKTDKLPDRHSLLGCYIPHSGTIMLWIDKIQDCTNNSGIENLTWQLLFQKTLLHELIHAIFDIVTWKDYNNLHRNKPEEETLDNAFVLECYSKTDVKYFNAIQGFTDIQPIAYRASRLFESNTYDTGCANYLQWKLVGASLKLWPEKCPTLISDQMKKGLTKLCGRMCPFLRHYDIEYSPYKYTTFDTVEEKLFYLVRPLWISEMHEFIGYPESFIFLLQNDDYGVGRLNEVIFRRYGELTQRSYYFSYENRCGNCLELGGEISEWVESEMLDPTFAPLLNVSRANELTFKQNIWLLRILHAIIANLYPYNVPVYDPDSWVSARNIFAIPSKELEQKFGAKVVSISRFALDRFRAVEAAANEAGLKIPSRFFIPQYWTFKPIY